jgi:NADH:ubiquinone oxidoreductase subunit E
LQSSWRRARRGRAPFLDLAGVGRGGNVFLARGEHVAGKIVICMGSSCFSRGNRKNLELIERFLAEHALTGQVILTGSRCEDQCCSGPNIKIDDRLHGGIDEAELTTLLKRQLAADREE